MATITITKGKAGAEDINFGTGTFERTASDGSTIKLTKVNDASIPITDANNVFSGEYLSAVLLELYELFTNSHVSNWYYQDTNGTILHGMGDIINQPADVEAGVSWYQKDSNGRVIHGMGDVITL